MKKTLSICILLMTLFCMTACSSSDDSSETNNASPSESIQQETDKNTNESEEQTESPEIKSTENAESAIDVDNQSEDEADILVAYFSATGTTKTLAEYAADIMNADLYEIIPEVPYTDADLNYSDSGSRSTQEMNDPSVRPATSGSVENMEQYDIIFLGYPIWWGEAPRIVDTFMESYDFSDKIIVPFCTSGGSGIGSSASNLHSLVSDSAIWLDGERLSSGTNRDDMAEWINGLGLDIKAE